MKCEIIKDLLPSYIDELTSDESNIEIENHLNNCVNCREELKNMSKEIKVEEINLNKENIKPLKKLNRKILNYVILSVSITMIFFIVLVSSYLCLFEYGWKINSDDINITYYLEDDNICFDFELKEDNKGLNISTILPKEENEISLSFKKHFINIFEYKDRKLNKFSEQIKYKDENGKINIENSNLKLIFKDSIKEINLNEILRELKVK